jgi:hypothetical protein
VQNSAFVHKQKSCPDLPPGSRVTSALPYTQCKSMILLSLTRLSTEGGHPYLLLSMLYTVIGCKPEMPVSKKKKKKFLSVADRNNAVIASKLSGLWRTQCISTGWNVQKRVFFNHRQNCSPSLHCQHRGSPASFKSPNPLKLWKNPGLSTQSAAFTITTILYTSF